MRNELKHCQLLLMHCAVVAVTPEAASGLWITHRNLWIDLLGSLE